MTDNKFDHKAIEDALAPTLAKALDVFDHKRDRYNFQFSLWTPEHKRYHVSINGLGDGDIYSVTMTRLSRSGVTVRKNTLVYRVTLAELPGVVRTLW